MAEKERRQGQLVPVPTMRRVFHQGFDRGGRLYCHGESYQQLPGEQRAEIVEIVGGEAVSMAELDYPAHHFRLAYARKGKKIPPGDPYCIPGFEDKRDLCKLGGLIAFNGDDMKVSAGALFKESGCTYDEAFKVLKAVWEKHQEIRYAFFSDTGARLMRVDSDMTVTLMKRFRDRAGYTPLPVHDSYIVRACDSEILATLMEEVFEEYRARMELAEQDEPTHTSPTSIYGVTFFPPTSYQAISPTPYEIEQIKAFSIYRNVSRVDWETEYWLTQGVLAELREEHGADQWWFEFCAKTIRKQERRNALDREKAERKAQREYRRELKAQYGIKRFKRQKRQKLTGDE